LEAGMVYMPMKRRKEKAVVELESEEEKMRREVKSKEEERKTNPMLGDK
jgi:hypothetical protein